MENLQAVPFIGIVEDLDDPKQLGRVRVRVLNHHDEDLPTEDLDWATVMHPTTSTAVKGAGMSPTWLGLGTTVFGFYIDGNHRNTPIVIGALGNIPNNDNSLHSVNRLARGESPTQKPVIGPEPKQKGKSQYPLNKTIETPGGHLIELDDTSGNQRINIRHASGAYVLINNDGTVVIRSEKDRIDVAKGDSKTFVEGSVKHTAKKNFSIELDGNFSVKSKGNCTVESSGTVRVKGKSIRLN